MIRIAAIAALGALSAVACSGTTGTVTVELTTAPSSTVLDAVQTMRLTITAPREVTESTRTSSGFDLSLDVDASGVTGQLIVEGLDASGALVACGQSPGFPVSAISANIVVYMAAPRSIALSPVVLVAPLSEVSATPLGYGVVVAGGLDASGAPATETAIYNAYDHTITAGEALPAARAGLALAADSSGGVYLFGGTGPDGSATGTLWRFDTTVAPSGSYTTVTDQASYARTGQLMVTTSTDNFLITGSPALTLASGTLTARTDITGLPATGAAAVASDAAPAAIFADTQLMRFHGTAFTTLTGTGRTNAAATTLPDGRVLVIGGGDPALSRDALAIDGATGAVTVIANALATPRTKPSVAATSRYVVVAGGTDDSGAPIATAEVLDATTLAPIITLPIVARSGAFAIALATDQVLIGGGAPATAQLELFTPDPPAL